MEDKLDILNRQEIIERIQGLLLLLSQKGKGCTFAIDGQWGVGKTYSNYVDIENGDEYWISGLKKRESNRHWAGHGKIMIDRRTVNEYLALIDEKELPVNLFEIIDIEDEFPVERVNKFLNDKE